MAATPNVTSDNYQLALQHPSSKGDNGILLAIDRQTSNALKALCSSCGEAPPNTLAAGEVHCPTPRTCPATFLKYLADTTATDQHT
jgi:hypothetical protein